MKVSAAVAEYANEVSEMAQAVVGSLGVASVEEVTRTGGIRVVVTCEDEVKGKAAYEALGGRAWHRRWMPGSRTRIEVR